MGDWEPHPQDWDETKANQAAAIIQSGRFKGDPAKLDKLSKALEWYEANRSQPKEDAADAAVPSDAPVDEHGEPAVAAAPAPAPKPKTVEYKEIEVSDPETGGPIQIQGDPYAGDAPVSGLEAVGRGATDTASFGFDNEASGLGAAYRAIQERIANAMQGSADAVAGRGDDQHGTAYGRTTTRGIDAPRMGVFEEAGNAYDDASKNYLDRSKQAFDEHQNLYRLGEAIGVGGTAALPFSSVGRAGRALGIGSRMLRAAPAAGLISGLASLGHSEAPDLAGKVKDTSEGVITGTLAGPIVGEVVGGTLSGLGKLAGGLQKASWNLRGRAVNTPPTLGPAADAFGQAVGESAPTAVGRKIEDLGLTKFAKYRPMNDADYAIASAARADDAGIPYGAILDRNSALGVETPKQDVQQEIVALRSKFGGATDNARAQRAVATRAARDLDVSPDFAGKDQLTVRDLQNLKNQFEKQGGYQKGVRNPEKVIASKEAARAVATVARKNLNDTMDAMALREDLPAFHNLSDEIQAARTIEGYANGTEGHHGITRPIMRAADNLVPWIHLWHDAASYGEDAAATGMKGLAALAKYPSKAAQWTADPAQRVALATFAQNAPAGTQIPANAVQNAYGAISSDDEPEVADSPTEESSEHGNSAEQAVLQTLQTVGDDEKLGPYKDELLAAHRMDLTGKSDGNAFHEKFTELMQDPRFVNEILPLISDQGETE